MSASAVCLKIFVAKLVFHVGIELKFCRQVLNNRKFVREKNFKFAMTVIRSAKIADNEEGIKEVKKRRV